MKCLVLEKCQTFFQIKKYTILPRVEAALARVQSRLEIIPKTCGLEISKVAKTDWIDWELLEKELPL